MAILTEEYKSFFSELKQNNNSEWFKMNKLRFEEFVKSPFEDLVTELIFRVGAEDKLIRLEPKEAIFRIYRDVRFSKDKTPYKTRMAAVIGPGGRKGMSAPGYYFEVSDDQIGIFGGLYMPEKEQIYNIRKAMASSPEIFSGIIGERDFQEKCGQVLGEKNKKLSPEFAAAALKQPLIFNKQFYYFTELPGDLVTAPVLADVILDYFMTGRKFLDFLREAING